MVNKKRTSYLGRVSMKLPFEFDWGRRASLHFL